jgi:hypothetical protein
MKEGEMIGRAARIRNIRNSIKILVRNPNENKELGR